MSMEKINSEELNEKQARIPLTDDDLEQVSGGDGPVALRVLTDQIREGECLSEFAVRHGVTVELLQEWNPQITNIDLVRDGQVISVPVFE